MKKILILLFISIMFNIAEAKDAPFKVERMITDFNGVVTNGSNTIAYGDYGIMTYSLDMGQTWKQQNIGDKYNIKRIVTFGDDFIGLTNYSLIKSTDNGLNWTNKTLTEESNLIDFTIIDNLIYILTTESILVTDLNLNIQSEKQLLLDTEPVYSDLETDGENLYFIKDNRFIQTLDVSTNQLISIDLFEEINCSSCDYVTNLRVTDKELYIQVVRIISGNTHFPHILKSADKGMTWVKINLNLSRDASYKIINEKIHYISPQSAAYSSNRNYNVNGYFRVDSSDIFLDTNYIRRLNPEEKLDRRINSAVYTDFTVYENNIIAVGKNKLISVSDNYGKTFEFKSNYNGYYDGMGYISFVTDSLIYINNGYEFYKTMDAGITWLPQKYSDYNSSILTSHPNYFYFDKNGNGFAKYSSINSENDSSALVTYDYGENFIKTDKPEFNIPKPYYFIPNGMDSKNGFDLGDKFIFIINGVKLETGDYNYTVIRYDKSLNLLDSINLNTDKIANVIKINDDNIIALVLQTSGTNTADENGISDDYEYNYYQIQSKDQGKTWNRINESLPISQPLFKKSDGTYFYGDVLINQSILFNNYIIYPKNNKIIYRYDYVNNEFDSIPYPGDNSLFNPYALFQFDNYLFSVSNLYKNTVYYTQDNDFENTTWDSLAGEDIFAGWNSYDFVKKFTNTDAILEAKMISNTSGYLVIGENVENKSGSKYLKANFVKITSNTTTDIVENDYQVENERTYLWNSSPYPIPGKSVINSRIYWNGTYSLSNLQLKVYNINGEELINPKINLNANNSYSGLLEWKCNDVSSGVYVIQVLLNGESINIPVVISK